MSEKITAVQRRLLEEVADLHGVPEGAYNIRANGHLASRQTTANISIESKTDVSGIDIRIKPGTVNESVHIPVVLSESGLKEMVYNDFYIGEGSDVLIVAGCGIDNCGSQDSQHDGLHRFFVEKNAHVRYVEKHYGSGEGTGKRMDVDAFDTWYEHIVLWDAGQKKIAVGTAVVVTAVSTGWILSVAGESLCFIANALARPHLHSRRLPV